MSGAIGSGLLGTLPQWGTFVAVIAAILTFFTTRRGQLLAAKTAADASWQGECKNLRQELREQKAQCDANEKIWRAELKRLNEELLGIRRQHVAEQISLINTIMRSVNAPELQTLREMLERVQNHMLAQHSSEEDREVPNDG